MCFTLSRTGLIRFGRANEASAASDKAGIFSSVMFFLIFFCLKCLFKSEKNNLKSLNYSIVQVFSEKILKIYKLNESKQEISIKK